MPVANGSGVPLGETTAMTISKWAKGADSAEVFETGLRSSASVVAWNVTRATYAVTPDVGVEFATVEDAERALEAAGWTRS